MSAPTAPTFTDDEPTMSHDEIVRALYAARVAAAAAEADRMFIEDQVGAAAAEIRDRYPAVYQQAAETKAEEQRLYALLRSAAVAAYQEEGSKSPIAGTTVKVAKDWGFDRDAALAFAKRTGMFLTLDVAAFEAYAKSQVTKAQLAQAEEDGEFKTLLEGVEITVTAVPSASVSKDLGPVVKSLGEA